MTWPHPSTHPPTHPPTHQTIHPPMGGEVYTDFKSSNGIEISRLVEVLLNFDWFRGSPPGGWGGGWMGVGGGERVYPTHVHMHIHARMHTHAHARARAFDIIGNFQGFPQWGWPFAWNYHAYHACMCVRVCACVCVGVRAPPCMCTCVGGTPSTHPPTPTPSTHPPTPRAAGSPKHQNSISLELIEIIRFCLKILYLWTFLNSYRL